jgi:hypothetical protein
MCFFVGLMLVTYTISDVRKNPYFSRQSGLLFVGLQNMVTPILITIFAVRLWLILTYDEPLSNCDRPLRPSDWLLPCAGLCRNDLYSYTIEVTYG